MEMAWQVLAFLLLAAPLGMAVDWSAGFGVKKTARPKREEDYEFVRFLSATAIPKGAEGNRTQYHACMVKRHVKSGRLLLSQVKVNLPDGEDIQAVLRTGYLSDGATSPFSGGMVLGPVPYAVQALEAAAAAGRALLNEAAKGKGKGRAPAVPTTSPVAKVAREDDGEDE